MTLYLGIDLGLSGALAWVDSTGAARVEPMPVVTGSKSRSVYDLPELLYLLSTPPPSLVLAEQLHAMPMDKGGSQANFSRGLALGLLQGVLVARGIPHQLVSPQAWQKVMLTGIAGNDTKQRSIIAAHRLFPGISLKRTERCRKDDDGIADALLLAAYARRVHEKAPPLLVS